MLYFSSSDGCAWEGRLVALRGTNVQFPVDVKFVCFSGNFSLPLVKSFLAYILMVRISSWIDVLILGYSISVSDGMRPRALRMVCCFSHRSRLPWPSAPLF